MPKNNDEERRTGASSRRTDDIEIDGPFGTHAKFRGNNVSIFLIAAVSVCGLGYLLYQHDQHSIERQAKLEASQIQIEKHMEEMIYVLTLTEKERTSLDLAMPASLRDRATERRMR